MNLRFLTSCAFALALAGPAFAVTDEAFLDRAMQINLSEISMGGLAQQQGSSEGIKQYGQRLVIDHIANAAQTLALLQEIGSPPATQPPAADLAIHEQLMGMNGGDFDRAFAARMVEGHRQAIALFEEKAGEEGRIADYAEATLPILQEHLQLAQGLGMADQQATGDAPEATAEQREVAAATETVDTSDDVAVERQRPTATMTTDDASDPQVKLATPETVSSESLVGMTVYGADSEAIGEISDVILSQDAKNGSIDAVIIDVGGFLGIGEKPVAVGFDALEIRTDADGGLHAYSRYTAEQLEAAPGYDADTYAQDRAIMRLSPQS